MKAAQAVLAWGDNRRGQLGDGTTKGRYRPAPVAGLTDVTSVAMGIEFACALKSDGTVWAWGYNRHGQLGDGSTAERHVPGQVPGLAGVVAIATATGSNPGQGWEANSVYALKSDGTVWAWGGNDHGQLGDGTTTDRYAPVQVKGLTGVTAITTGQDAENPFDRPVYALKSDGTVWAWGPNQYGQLGDGTVADRHTPVPVFGLTGVTAISSTGWRAYALRHDGTVWAWGYNKSGQLGDGTTTERHIPVQVLGLTGLAAITSRSSDSTFALKSDGTVWAWGANQYGQLGDGTTTPWPRFKATPVQVAGLTGITEVTACDKRVFAVKSDGTVWAWGSNDLEQLCDGTRDDRNSPVQVPSLRGVAAITTALNGFSTFSAHPMFAVKSDGTVWAWGDNTYFQCGNADWYEIGSKPEQVHGLGGVISIIAGYKSVYTLV